MTRTQTVVRPRIAAAFAVALLLLTTVLTFGVAGRVDAAPAAQLPVGSWVLESNPAITLDVAPDGHVSGSGGLNRYATTMVVNADGTVDFAPFMTTLMGGPNDVMAAEHAFLMFLEGVVQADVAGATLTLTTGDGVSQVFVAA
ncbi:META domain-containing protein [Miniimonas sp. S16]|uniref:META domain-containing protein n=1 Tax=Miniimonas sp. S16 TaxID=2171623 RepID=UPI000D525F47|nr:META domain-containing protein [Miniimonas sp. S16]